MQVCNADRSIRPEREMHVGICVLTLSFFHCVGLTLMNLLHYIFTSVYPGQAYSCDIPVTFCIVWHVYVLP